MNIDFEKFIKNNQLFLIRINLEELPKNLEKLTDKAYKYTENDFILLKQKQKSFYDRLKEIPENIGYDENGNEISNHDWLISQADENFINDAEVIEYFKNSIHAMLINFYYETYTNLKKQIKDQLKEINLETNNLDKICNEVYEESKIEKVNLINNCIKHNNFIIDKKLARKYPKEFKKDLKIEIDEAFVYSMLKITQDAINLLTIKFSEKYFEK